MVVLACVPTLVLYIWYVPAVLRSGLTAIEIKWLLLLLLLKCCVFAIGFYYTAARGVESGMPWSPLFVLVAENPTLDTYLIMHQAWCYMVSAGEQFLMVVRVSSSDHVVCLYTVVHQELRISLKSLNNKSWSQESRFFRAGVWACRVLNFLTP